MKSPGSDHGPLARSCWNHQCAGSFDVHVRPPGLFSVANKNENRLQTNGSPNVNGLPFAVNGVASTPPLPCGLPISSRFSYLLTALMCSNGSVNVVRFMPYPSEKMCLLLENSQSLATFRPKGNLSTLIFLSLLLLLSPSFFTHTAY